MKLIRRPRPIWHSRIIDKRKVRTVNRNGRKLRTDVPYAWRDDARAWREHVRKCTDCQRFHSVQ